jgi:DNA-repair protein XRCC1
METTPAINFGPFKLRSADNKDNDSETNSGSLFAKQKTQSDEPSTAPKQSFLATAVGLTSNSPKTPVTKPKTPKPMTSQTSPKVSHMPSNSHSPSSSSSSNRQTGPSPPKKARNVAQNVPFNQIMSGVVFALSGFVNPKRGDIRDEALKMGAKYRPDWDQNCTHLM